MNEEDRKHHRQIVKKQLQWVLLLRIVLYTALLAINFFLEEAENGFNLTLPSPFPLLLILFIYSFSILSAIHLQKESAQLQRVILIQVFVDNIIASFFVYLTGASYSIFVSIFFFPVISGALILKEARGLSQATAATFLYAGILYLEYANLLPSYIMDQIDGSYHNTSYLLHAFATQGLLFFLVGFLSYLIGTRLQKAEFALASSRAKYQQLSQLHKHIYENINSGIISLDPQYKITSINKAGRKILSKRTVEIMGRNINELFTSFDPKTLHVDKSLNFPSNNDKLTIRYSSIALDTDQESNSEVESPQGKHQIIVFKDVTKLEELEKQLRQAEKLAAIGTMSASIAHDFRNPLTAILGCSQILSDDLVNKVQNDESQKELVEIIENESSRLLASISNFLYFARPNTPHFSWFSLTHCIQEAYSNCQKNSSWPSSCLVDIHVENNLDIYADREQLQTIFTHLFENAIVFCPQHREKIQIKAEEKLLDSENEGIKITFEDNGTGVAKEERGKIFEPFFTNRTDGTGLGLSIVNQYVTGHGGNIAVEKGNLGGACFVLTFPFPT